MAWFSTSKQASVLPRAVTSCTTALVLLLLLVLAATPAHGVPILLQVTQYILLPAEDRGQSNVAYTRELASNWCLDRGFSLVADSRTEITSMIATRCMTQGTRDCPFILDGSAKPPDQTGRQKRCVEDVKAETGSESSMWCTYRWRLGFYDLFAEVGGTTNSRLEAGFYNPGTCYWKCLYYTREFVDQGDAYAVFCNGFVMQTVWNSSIPLGSTVKGYPRGKFFTTGCTVTSGHYFRSDVPEVIENNDPHAYGDYTIVCNEQEYPLPALWTTKQPQPAIVKGYKDLTWAQKHWWVIFLIIAVVLLAILLFIIIYCSVTAVKPKEQPPITMMVQREREGQLYAELDDAPKSRNLPEDDEPPMVNGGGSMYSAPPPTQGYPPMYVQPVDPEDLQQGIPRVFSQDDTALMSQNDSFAITDGEDENEENGENDENE